jgi:chromosome segregation ATPase
MDPSGKTLEEKIANIKFTLKELGQSLEHEEKYERIPASPKDKPQDSSFSYKPRVIQEKVDLKLLYTYEKERNSMLEARIMQKDELVSEMTSLQNDLYINLEELQSKVSMLESDLAFLRRQNLSLNEEIQSFSDLLHSKDLEISRLVEEKDKYFSYLLEKDEESRLLNDELQTQEPDKRLIQALVIPS